MTDSDPLARVDTAAAEKFNQMMEAKRAAEAAALVKPPDAGPKPGEDNASRLDRWLEVLERRQQMIASGDLDGDNLLTREMTDITASSPWSPLSASEDARFKELAAKARELASAHEQIRQQRREQAAQQAAEAERVRVEQERFANEAARQAEQERLRVERERIEAEMLAQEAADRAAQEATDERARQEAEAERARLAQEAAAAAVVPISTATRTEPVVEPAPVAPPEVRPGPAPESRPRTIEVHGRAVDISAIVENLALRQAEKQMTELMNNSRWYNRWWVRLNEEGRKRELYKEALKSITDNKNLSTLIQARMLGKTKVVTGDIGVSYKILDEVMEAYEKDIVTADEKGEVIRDADINLDLAQIFYKHSTGKYASRQDFEREVSEKVVPRLQSLDKRKFTDDAGRQNQAEGRMYAQNFWQLAESYKDQIQAIAAEHGAENEEALQRYIAGIMNVDIHLGLKQKELFNTQPQGKMSWMERAVDKLQSVPIFGKVVANPALFGGVASLLTQGAVKGFIRKGLIVGGTAMFFGPTAASLLAGGVIGGAYMWFRRSRDLKHDRGMDARRQALGEEAGGPRTEKVREYAYEFRSAKDSGAVLEAMLSKDSLTDEDKKAVADIMARLGLERQMNVDLFYVSSQAGKSGVRMFEMNPMLLALKQVKEKFGLSEASLADLVRQQTDSIVDSINHNDKDFESFRRKESVKAAIGGAIAGIAGGALAQYGVDQVRHLMGGVKHGSVIEGAWHMMTRGKPYEMAQGALIEQHVPGLAGRLSLPQGYGFIDHPTGDHHFIDIQDPDGNVIAQHLTVGSDGKFTQEAINQLHDRGFGFEDHIRKAVGDIDLADNPHSATLDDLKNTFHDQLGKHARVDWHDEPGKRLSNFFHKMIEFEGKQQMLYLEKDANGMVFINADKIAKNLLDNAHHALDQFGRNPDGSFDSKLQHLVTQLEQWSKEGTLAQHLQSAIIPTEEANKKGLSIVTQGFMDKGHYKIPLPKELWAAFSDPASFKDGHLPFRFDELRLDGHVLATAQGSDYFVPGGIAKPHEIFVTDYKVIPPVGDPDYFPPTPMWPRFPLERTRIGGVPTDPERGYGYGKQKEYLTDLNVYRTNDKQREAIIRKLSKDDAFKAQYGFVLERLEALQKYKQLGSEDQAKLENELERYNKRYFGDDQQRYISLDEYVRLEIDRTFRQVENLLIERAEVGDKPFAKEFYKNSPLINGIEKADEIDIILDDPIGDAVMTVPAIEAVDKYLSSKGMTKKIKVITRHPALFKSLESQFKGRVEIIDSKDMKSAFGGVKKKRFIINTNKSFEDYDIFGYNDSDSEDPRKVMSVDWASWTKEESPQSKRLTKKYDPIPARVMRNFEIMFGQKLFPNINGMKKFIDRDPRFKAQAAELTKKYDIKEDERVIVISPGSSVMPKEYTPDRWAKVIENIFVKYPNAHILFLEDPDPNKSYRYGTAINQLIAKGYKISRVKEGFNRMNTIMSMAEVAITPDTGLGHFAGAVGTPNVMFMMGDPVRWSTAETRRVIHEKGYQSYRLNRGTYGVAWEQPNEYFVNDNGTMVGASDIAPEEISDRVDIELKARRNRPT